MDVEEQARECKTKNEDKVYKIDFSNKTVLLCSNTDTHGSPLVLIQF